MPVSSLQENNSLGCLFRYAAAGTTQTVALVKGAITNQVGTKVVSAKDRMLTLTNAPWLFAGDAVRVTTTATNAFGAVLVGEAAD